MKLRLHENSLFAILLRAHGGVSLLAALGAFGVVRLFMHEGYALFAASPFIAIAAIAAWKRLRVPGGARLEAGLAKLRGMPWEEVAALLEEGFRREGYAVKRLAGAPADFELEKAGRVSLAAAKRWKASRTGVEPLKELHGAAAARAARGGGGGGGRSSRARGVARASRFQSLANCFVRPLLLGGFALDGIGQILGGVVARAGLPGFEHGGLRGRAGDIADLERQPPCRADLPEEQANRVADVQADAAEDGLGFVFELGLDSGADFGGQHGGRVCKRGKSMASV